MSDDDRFSRRRCWVQDFRDDLPVWRRAMIRANKARRYRNVAFYRRAIARWERRLRILEAAA